MSGDNNNLSMTTQKEKAVTIKERLLKQRKPQWALDLINQYIDVKEDEVDDLLSELEDRLNAIHEEYSRKFCAEMTKEISTFQSDLIGWRNGSYLECEDIEDEE
jgi:phage host-nuclease inhibitor protein Gam